MKEDSIEDQMINRGERKAYNFMSEGEFRPLKISPSVQEIFEINAENLGVRNPFEQAEDIIDNIMDILEYVPLTSDYFPDLLNPFKNLPEPTWKEVKVLKEKLDLGYRLACQFRISHDIEIKQD